MKQRKDLRGFDGTGVYIQFESSENAESVFNDSLAKEINISKYGSNKFLNEDNTSEFTFFPKKTAHDAEETVQTLNAIMDDGEAAEKQLEEDTAESEAAEAEGAAIQLRFDPDVLSDEEFYRRTAKKTKKPKKNGPPSAFGGEVSNLIGKIVDQGEDAENAIYANAFPEAAKIKARKLKKPEFDAPILDDKLDYDTSDVQIQFVDDYEDVKWNDELAGEGNNNLQHLGDKGFLIEGEIGMRNFTYFPAWKSELEGADELKQFLNSLGDSGDVAEEQLETATAEAEATEAA